jgi:probable phosphoglycerate mutase
MVRVILVRHGETDWNKIRRIQGGGSDTQLNKRGEQQAEGLAFRLSQERIQAIYSSALHRTLDTARAIARYHQLEVEIEPSLNEISAGELEGVLMERIGGRLDQLLTGGGQGDVTFKVPGGESLSEVQQRAWRTIQRLVNQHPDGVLVVVSHYFIILTIICAVLNLPLSQIDRLSLSPGTISTIVFDGQTPRLVLFNDSCHLKNI